MTLILTLRNYFSNTYSYRSFNTINRWHQITKAVDKCVLFNIYIPIKCQVTWRFISNANMKDHQQRWLLANKVHKFGVDSFTLFIVKAMSAFSIGTSWEPLIPSCIALAKSNKQIRSLVPWRINVEDFIMVNRPSMDEDNRFAITNIFDVNANFIETFDLKTHSWLFFS